MNLAKLFKWLLLDQYVFHIADDDGGGDGDGDAGDGDAGDGDDDNQPLWRDDWRDQLVLAETDEDKEKELGQLGRYQSPKDIWTKTRALEQKLSSGEYKQTTPYPEKGTDEQKAEWRTNNGVPEAADKYELGREVGEEEKPVIDKFLGFAHERNIPGAHVKDMVDWFYTKQEADLEQINEEQKAVAKAAEDELRVEWGADYRAYINHVDNLIESAPKDVKEVLLDAVLPTGESLRDNPPAMKFLLGLALEKNPITTLVPGGGDQASAIQDEIDEIKGKMNTKEYQNSPKMRARYRELIAARQKMAS
jgi:hypothetical protein